VNPAACVTGVVDSAPRTAVHVVPDVAAIVMISDGSAGSATWNWVAFSDADGHPVADATVHVSTVPPAGADVPPELTVVDGLLA
jgi:hypothetical protein